MMKRKYKIDELVKRADNMIAMCIENATTLHDAHFYVVSAMLEVIQEMGGEIEDIKNPDLQENPSRCFAAFDKVYLCLDAGTREEKYPCGSTFVLQYRKKGDMQWKYKAACVYMNRFTEANLLEIAPEGAKDGDEYEVKAKEFRFDCYDMWKSEIQ